MAFRNIPISRIVAEEYSIVCNRLFTPQNEFVKAHIRIISYYDELDYLPCNHNLDWIVPPGRSFSATQLIRTLSMSTQPVKTDCVQPAAGVNRSIAI